MLKSGLSVYCYSLSNPVRAINYTQYVTNLSFTTVAPGGFGQATCTILLPDSRVFHPELQIFARMAIMAQRTCVFIGEIAEAPLLNSDTEEGISITALGLGATLRDDPEDVSYSAQTPLQIVNDQFTRRAAYLVIDPDTSEVFPDQPSATFSPAYTGRNMEEVIADVAILAGVYSWGTWAHPTHVDALGFPTGQLTVRKTDRETVAYQASISGGDSTRYTISPSMERAYNVIAITFNDASQTPPVGTAVYTDPRLNADGSQGTAPFRRRKYSRDMTTVSMVSMAQAQAIANAYGAQMQNISNKVELTLRNLQNADGAPIPLWMAAADKNIAVPELTPRGAAISASYTPGTNLFYIVQTTYTETATDMNVVLECDNYIDTANMQIARLQLASDALARSKTTTGAVQTSGAPEIGYCGLSLPSMGAGQSASIVVHFKTIMKHVPTSITLNAVQTANVSTSSANSMTAYGFVLTLTALAAGAMTYYATYTTVGN